MCGKLPGAVNGKEPAQRHTERQEFDPGSKEPEDTCDSSVFLENPADGGATGCSPEGLH